MRKLRILHVGEFSRLSTGYSTYAFEVMQRLHQLGKYELAELACYITRDDDRTKTVPWQVFPNHPKGDRPQEIEEFNSKRANEFGEYTFEKVCLQFQPDIIWSIRDWWADEFIERSPFRPYYHWVYMPTVDSTPQHEQWLATFMNADAIFTYSDWGADILRKEGGGLINVQGSASPGADLVTFTPMDKPDLRRKFHFEKDVNIVGTVMRNMARKLYPELMASFADFQQQAPADMAKKTFLYLHTTYPDQGWDIPRLIKHYGISSKTLVTYKCKKCRAVFPSFFMDAVAPCNSCGELSAQMPNTHDGIDRERLAKIINLFDVYVQYSTNEGFGLPIVEAASCGIPVFATDYSAMSDVVRKVHGYPIKVAHYRMDNQFGCFRAIPDNQDFIDKLIHFFSLDQSQRDYKARKARQGVERYYTWDRTAEKWSKVFDELGRPSRHWDSPAVFHIPYPLPSEPITTNEQFVDWAITYILGKPEMRDSYLALRLIRDLNWGYSLKSLSGEKYASEDSFIVRRSDLKKFTPDDAIRELTSMCEYRNMWEKRRMEMLQKDDIA